MSYAAEPYAQFVDDLLRGLTGGEVRERFVFLPENAPYRLAPPGPVVPGSLAVYGLAAGAFRAFRRDQDYGLAEDGKTIGWRARADGTPAADATWPDEGTPFYANYDHKGPGGLAPLLNDRNPGSVVRLLAESFGRELAVMSRQLEAVYRGGYLDTATGKDLDQVVALVGVTRRDRRFAAGAVVFSRSTPADADIFLPAGTKLSTADAPIVEFETTADRTLQRGNLSVEAPVRASVGGAEGVVGARAIRVIHRPILGIEGAANAQPTALGGKAESDDEVRSRARRALESAARATPGAIIGALATLEGVREKDVRLEEDPVVRPGVVTVHVAAELTEEGCRRALDLVERTRPAGVRMLHNFDCSAAVGVNEAGPNPREGTAELEPLGSPPEPDAPLFHPVRVRAILLPAGRLTPEERAALARRGQDAVTAFVEAAGIGETLVYNRLVAALMELDGVLDVTVELSDAGVPGADAFRNLQPPATLRPTIDSDHGGALRVEVAGVLVAFEITMAVDTMGVLAPDLAPDQTAAKETVRSVVAAELREGISTLAHVDAEALIGLIVPSEHYVVTELHYTVTFIDAGIRIRTDDEPLDLTPLERPWVRSAKLMAPTP